MSETDERPATQEDSGFDGTEEISMTDVSTTTLPEGLPVTMQAKIKRKALGLISELTDYEAHPDQYPQHKKLNTAYKQAAQWSADKPTPVITPPRPAKEPPMVSAQRSAKKVEKAHKMTGPVRQKGKWMEEGTASASRPRSADRHLHLLNQFSEILLGQVKGSQEIEAMLVNGRIVISANEQKNTVEKLAGLPLDEVLRKEAERLESEEGFAARKGRHLGQTAVALAMKDDDRDPTDTELSGMDRLARYETDSIRFPDQAESVSDILATLKKIMTDKLKPVMAGDPAKAGDYIRNGKYQGNIIVVDAWDGSQGTCSHAEQNLLSALLDSGHKSGAVIAGGKRPCTVCWLSLMLVNAHGYNVTFNTHPGGFWDGTTYKGLHRIAVKLGYTEATLGARLLEFAGADTDFEQYVTQVRLTATKDLKVELLEALKDARFATDTSTQTQSPPYEFPDYVPEMQYLGLWDKAEKGTKPYEGEKAIPLDGTPMTIGRTGFGNSINLDSTHVSRKAAEIWAEGEKAKLKALSDKNGVVTVKGTSQAFVAGDTYTLSAGDGFRIGPYKWVIG